MVKFTVTVKKESLISSESQAFSLKSLIILTGLIAHCKKIELTFHTTYWSPRESLKYSKEEHENHGDNYSCNDCISNTTVE